MNKIKLNINNEIKEIDIPKQIDFLEKKLEELEDKIDEHSWKEPEDDCSARYERWMDKMDDLEMERDEVEEVLGFYEKLLNDEIDPAELEEGEK